MLLTKNEAVIFDPISLEMFRLNTRVGIVWLTVKRLGDLMSYIYLNAGSSAMAGVNSVMRPSSALMKSCGNSSLL